MNDSDNVYLCAARLKVLAEPCRLRIIDVLVSGAKQVGVLADELNEPLAKTSFHLITLQHAGILLRTKLGRYAEYCLNPSVCLGWDEAVGGTVIDLGYGRLALNGSSPPATASPQPPDSGEVGIPIGKPLDHSPSNLADSPRKPDGPSP